MPVHGRHSVTPDLQDGSLMSTVFLRRNDVRRVDGKCLKSREQKEGGTEGEKLHGEERS